MQDLLRRDEDGEPERLTERERDKLEPSCDEEEDAEPCL